MGLKTFGDGLEPKDHVNRSKLPITVEKDFRLPNSIKICEVYQVTIWGSVKLICKRNREKKLVRQ